MNRYRRSIRSELACAALALLVLVIASPARAQDATYIGEAKCVVCHVEQKPNFAHTAHAKAMRANPANELQAKVCEACHGPGSRHVKNSEDKSLIIGFTRSWGTPIETQNSQCLACHKGGQRLFWSGSTHEMNRVACADCHKDDDVHAGQMGAKCTTCHTTLTWTGGKYDHDKAAFKLTGAHDKVECNACHLGGKYKGTPQRCAACHLPDDVHQGSRGDKCAECHTTETWKSAKFDHGKETGFALLGRHSGLDCGACHKQADFKDKLPRTCVGCHKADDAHALRFGEDCKTCHGNDAWKPGPYDHLAKHQFALEGAHADLDCHACHTADVKKQKLGKDCAACHRASDPHGGALGLACDSCHGVQKWKQDIRFDHDLTDWPLMGMHSIVSCGQCHASRAFKGAPKDCLGCHAQDDVHKGGLGKDCAACHTTNGWKSWDFDHARQTGFALSGAHAKAKCVDCHRQPAGLVKLAGDCASCHRKDDIHLGQYGTQCQRCHTTLTFKGARIQ